MEEVLGVQDKPMLCCAGAVPLPLKDAEAEELAALLANERVPLAGPVA